MRAQEPPASWLCIGVATYRASLAGGGGGPRPARIMAAEPIHRGPGVANDRAAQPAGRAAGKRRSTFATPAGRLALVLFNYRPAAIGWRAGCD